MSKVVLIAKLTCEPDNAPDLEAALAALVTAAGEEEGLEVYAVSKNSEEPGTYVFYEVYTDQAARDVHGKGEAMRAAMGAVGALLSGRPEVTTLDPVAAKGLAL